MKTIGIMIAATEELHQEKVALVDLIVHLNKLLENKGIKLKPQVWTPEEKKEAEAYINRLNDCEMCLNLYWQELDANAINEIEMAYERLKKGSNPRHLYIFFKEPTEFSSEELKDFKTSFVTDYGHFYCKFENIDTMNLQFLLQFEATHNINDNKLVEVKDGQVQISGESIVDLNNIPFAYNNKEFKRLQREIEELDNQIDTYKKLCTANPEINDNWMKLNELNNRRKELSKRYNDYQDKMYHVALYLTQALIDKTNERLEMAKNLFEQGDVDGADQALDLNMIAKEDERTAKQYKNIRESRIKILDEYCVKTKIVMLNHSLPFPERIKNASIAYDRAIAITQELQLPPSFRLHCLFFDYAYFMNKYREEGPGNREKAIRLNTIALKILKQLNDPKLDHRIAATLLNQAVYLERIERFHDAEQVNEETLRIYKSIKIISLFDKKNYSTLLDNLGIRSKEKGLLEKAESYFKEALEIRKDLVKNSENKNRLRDLTHTLTNLADLKRIKHQYSESNQLLQKALDISKALFRHNPDLYSNLKPEVLICIAELRCDEEAYQNAEILFKKSIMLLSKIARINQKKESLSLLSHSHFMLGILYHQHGQDILQDNNYEELALSHYKEACDIYRRLAIDNPKLYQPKNGYNSCRANEI